MLAGQEDIRYVHIGCSPRNPFGLFYSPARKRFGLCAAVSENQGRSHHFGYSAAAEGFIPLISFGNSVILKGAFLLKLPGTCPLSTDTEGGCFVIAAQVTEEFR